MRLIDDVKDTWKPKYKNYFVHHSVARATAIKGVFMGNTYSSCLAKFLDSINQSGVH